MGARQQAGLEALDALRQRLLQVERTDDAVLGGAERQVDHRHRRLGRWQRAGRLARAALVAERGAGGRIAAVAAALDHLHLRQQRGERPHGGGLAPSRGRRGSTPPPTAGSTAAIRIPSFISAWPAMAEKGNGKGF